MSVCLSVNDAQNERADYGLVHILIHGYRYQRTVIGTRKLKKILTLTPILTTAVER